MKLYYAALVEPFYQFSVPSAKPQSVASVLLATSMIKASAVQKFVLEVCEGLTKFPSIASSMQQSQLLAVGFFLK